LFLETSREYGRGLLRGIVRYSRLHGPWVLYLAPWNAEQALPKPESWNGTGIIARMRSQGMAKAIRATGLPFVASSLDESRPPRPGDKFGYIGTNSTAVAHVVATHLLERGLRHFAFCGFANSGWSASREKAFCKFLDDRGFKCQTHRIEIATSVYWTDWFKGWDRDPLQRVLKDWLMSLPKPVGLMACNDIGGRLVLQACAAAKLRLPDEVAVVGVDNDELLCELANPPLSSVALDLEKAGYEAARLLDSVMSGHLPAERRVLVEPVRVVSRQSSEIMAPGEPRVSTALQFIQSHAGQPIGVPHVIDQAGVCRRTLERLFSRTLGRSISSEITRCRLERAKRLLLESDLHSYSVAAAAGFGSLKTFNRVFRRATSVPPTRFRQNSKALD
jgi:LacI family transcriptional regulator